MWPIRSLRTQLLVNLGLIVALAAATLYGWLYGEFLSAEGKMRDWAVAGQARYVAGYLSVVDGRVQVNLPDDIGPLYDGPKATRRYVVTDDAGRVLAAAGWSTGDTPRVAPHREGRIYEYLPVGDDLNAFVGFVEPVTVEGRRLWVQAEQERRDRYVLVSALLEDFLEDGGWIPIPIFIVILLAGGYMIRRALAPLERLSHSAEAIGPANVSVRLDQTGVPSEALPLVHAINRGLDRLEIALNLQRDFTADAAHELRTPLALLMAQVERLRDQNAARPMLGDLQGMARLVEQLLRAAQLETLTLGPSGSVDLAEVAKDIATYLAPLAIDAEREIAVEGVDRPVVVPGNAGALHHALRNLVENALAHTATGTTVTIIVIPATPACGGGIEVRDRGPGIPEAQRGDVFKRFWRAERGDRRSGAGLGLSIVDKAMQLHGGRVVVGDAPGGGAAFRLEFPPLSS